MTKELIERLRSFEVDHQPDGWPAIQMKYVSALLDALEQAQAERAALQADLDAHQTAFHSLSDSTKASDAEIEELKAKNQVLLRELNYIAGISTGQVKRVAEQAIAGQSLAPEPINQVLLDALKELERAVRWVDHPSVNKVWDKARAAIAQVEGKQ